MRRWRWTVLLSAWLAAGGCTMRDQLTRQGTDYNQLSADVHDRVLLTNILRARDNAPVHFSVVSQIRGAASVRASASLSAPFGRYLSTANTVGMSAETSASPTLDVTTLETQEFTQGLLAPIEPALFKLFWDRGYQPQLLLRLLVNEVLHNARRPPVPGSVEEQCNKPIGERRSSDPAGSVNSVDCWIDYWTSRGATDLGDRLRLNSYRLHAPVGPHLSDDQARDSRLLSSLTDSGSVLRLRRDPDDDPRPRYRLYRVTDEVAFCSDGTLLSRLLSDDAPRLRQNQVDTLERKACSSTSLFLPDGTSAVDAGAPNTVIRLRSVDQILYFLGQLAKDPEQPGNSIFITRRIQPCIADNGFKSYPRAYLFRLLERADGPVSVVYRGERYSVPPYAQPEPLDGDCSKQTPGDRSLQVFSLLTHLINLKRKAADLPTTRAVQVIN